MSTWGRQYEASKTSDIPEIDHLYKWLNNNIPKSAGKTSKPLLYIVAFLSYSFIAEYRSLLLFITAIVHGDFRLENMIFHPTEVLFYLFNSLIYNLVNISLAIPSMFIGNSQFSLMIHL